MPGSSAANLLIVVGVAPEEFDGPQSYAYTSYRVVLWDAGTAAPGAEVGTLYQVTPDRILVDWSPERRDELSAWIYVKEGEVVTVRVNADLTGTTWEVLYQDADFPETPFAALDSTAVDELTGQLELDTSALAEGAYSLAVVVTDSSGQRTFPTRGFATLSVEPAP